MASRGTRKVGTHRMDGAIAALTPLGFSKKLIRGSIKELIKVYGDNEAGWYFVEENYYKLVIDKIIEDQSDEKGEHDLEAKEEEVKTFEEAKITETYGQALFQLVNSSSNADISSMEKSMHGRDPLKLVGPCDMVPCIGVGPENPSSPPIRRPCYGWISEDED